MSFSSELRVWLSACAVLALAACSQRDGVDPEQAGDAAVDAAGFHAATQHTLQANQITGRALDNGDTEDFELARRGLIAGDPDLEILSATGDVVWRPADYAFLDETPPASANPSLWRQARLNNIHGLFEVVPGIYQVRGYDLANMSVVAGETGWIVIDPLTSVETARAALDLVNRELGPRPVSAVILTHSHIDHFGGLAAIAPPEAFENGDIPLIAPAGFLEESVSENVMAGIVMGRRAGYMYGSTLPRSPRGHIGSGLGKHPSLGTHTIARPNLWVSETGQTMLIDGIDLEFQHAPHSEAPAELTVYLPQFRAWCGAEIVSRTMHNLYTLRGAQVRDALAWSSAIESARLQFGHRSDVVFNSHHWPVWGVAEIDTYLAAQRDIYKYIHDQTLRLASAGLGADEIAETLELPPALAATYSVRGYYGTLRHNVRAVYQRYFGWYDGVPAQLNALPRTQAASLYVDAVGGMDAILILIDQAFAEGNYRWSAELAQHAVFADGGHPSARAWLARSYEQLGYQAESGPWRDVYLSAAFELRHGIQALDMTEAGSGILNAIPLDMFFAAMATRLDGPRASERNYRFNFVFTDVGETHIVEVSNGVMRHRQGEAQDGVDATVEVTRAFWMRLLQRDAGLLDIIASRDFAVSGDRAALLGFFALLEQPEPAFPIVTP